MGPRIGAGATSRDLARRSRGRAKRVRSRGPRRHQHLCPKAKHPIMKLTIERAALLKSLTHVQSVVERRNTIPILSNVRSEEHTSELQSLMRISYAVFCLKKKKTKQQHKTTTKKR